MPLKLACLVPSIVGFFLQPIILFCQLFNFLLGFFDFVFKVFYFWLVFVFSLFPDDFSIFEYFWNLTWIWIRAIACGTDSKLVLLEPVSTLNAFLARHGKCLLYFFVWFRNLINKRGFTFSMINRISPIIDWDLCRTACFMFFKRKILAWCWIFEVILVETALDLFEYACIIFMWTLDNGFIAYISNWFIAKLVEKRCLNSLDPFLILILGIFIL